MRQSPFDDDNPVRTGLVALVGVSLAVGLILAIAAVIGTHVLGIAGGDGSSAGAGQGESMYLPPPEKTTDSVGPLITLNTQDASAPEESGSADSASSEPTESKSAKPTLGEISLQALETTVPNFGKIDLTGVYPGGEGEILQVQRKQSGQWVDFQATVPVSNATFSTYIQTGVSGKNTFRVFDKSRNVASNPVEVTVG
ncbi:MAG TPA: hypothetical protein VN088_00140 [Nocardioides sp.]|nr:hypothetical protein [Nocardioides sp.]